MISKIKELYQGAHAHSGFQRYFKNSSWLFGGQLLRMVLGLFVSVAVARYLGPGDFGLYSYVSSIVALVGVVCTLGLQNVAKRDMVEFPEDRDEILGTCFSLSALAGLIGYAAMMLCVACMNVDSLALGMFALLGGSLLLSPFKFIEVWFQSQVKGNLSVVSTSTALLLFAVAKVAAIILGASLIWFAFIFLCESICVIVIQSILYRRNYASLAAWIGSWGRAKSLLSQAWPLIVSGIAVTVYMRIDQVMLGSMVGELAVGEYAAATRISTVWYFIPTLLAASLFPAIVNAKKQGEVFYMKRLQRYFDLNAALAYTIVLPFSFLAPWLIELLFGGQYAGSASILSIHIWTSLFVFTGVARGQYLITEGFFKFSLVATVTGAIVNIALNYYLIPLYSGVGAAVATLVSQFISALGTSFFYRKLSGICWLQLRSLFLIFRLKSVFSN
jgi:O-antigen/teichoic acid export membrane protein